MKRDCATRKRNSKDRKMGNKIFKVSVEIDEADPINIDTSSDNDFSW